MIRKLLLVAISFFIFTSLFTKVVEAQYCSGSASCVEQVAKRVCSGGGSSCSGNTDCDVGERCTTVADEFDVDGGTCILGGGGTACVGSCPRGGFIGRPCGSPYYPPAPTPPRQPPPPPPECTGTECETDPPPPPEDTYMCNPCSGTCQLSAGGSTLQGCSASCTVSLPPEMCCTNCGGTPAGESSCADLRDSATEDVVMPGETVTWTTWGSPPGNSPEERLANASPGLITKSYTSPGNMVTIAFMFRVPEGQPHNFYIYDETNETFYFFVDEDKPVVIASRNQEIVDIAVNDLGYTFVDPDETSVSEAREIEKRVYKLIDDGDGDPWEFPDNGPRRPVTFHMPMDNEHNIPWVNCASLFRASGHSDYYSTNLQDAYEDDSLFCFRRQPITWRFPQDDEEDEFNETVMTGNYFGMEIDWPRNMWRANQGESEGELIWPRTNLYEGTDLFKYSDELQFAAMGIARDWENKGRWTPSFLRQAMVQIPVQLFNEGTHNLYALTHLGPGPEPVPDENSSQGCFLNNEGDSEEIIVDEKLYGFDNSIEEVPPLCEGFKVTETATGRVINPGDKVRRGETYTIRTNARAESRIFSFYNSSFNDPHLGVPGTIDNWEETGSISTFEVVDCDNLSGGCHDENTDDQVLKVARINSSDQASSTVRTEYIETNTDVTGYTFSVEFWARVDGSDKVIPQILLERGASTKMAVPYNTLGHPADVRDLRFSNYASSDLNDTTSSITVTNEWQKFYGAVTFNYDTSDPSGHPNGNTSTNIRLTLKAPSNNDNIYYDDVTIIGWKQPTTYFRMASAIPGPTSGYDQCDLSIWADETHTNLSGGHFWADLTIPEDATPGTYNMFAALRTSIAPSFTYFGNPNAVENCNLNSGSWNDDIASPPLSALQACMRTVEVIACNETTPAMPIVTDVYNADNTLPNLPTASGQAKFNDIRISNTTLSIVAEPGGTQAQKDAVTAMSLYITPYNSADAEIILEGLRTVDNTYIFTHQMTEEFTNEFTISIQAYNEDSCNSTNLLTSPEFLRHIRIMTPREGRLINVPKEQYDTYNCRDTRESLVGKGQSDWIVDITSDPEVNFTTMQFTANTTDSFNPITATYHSTFRQFKQLSYGTIGKQFVTDLPYNPLNVDAWRNKITSFTLDLPQNNTEESYICLEACNPNVGDDLNPRCQAAGSPSNPYMVIPKPQYPGYPHGEYINDLNIYVAKGNFNDAWWQARGGLVFANGSISSDLPLFNGNPRSLCNAQVTTDVCLPFITAKSLGLPGHLNADISSGFQITNGASVSPDSWRTQAVGPIDPEPVSMSSNIDSSVSEDFAHFHELVDDNKDNPLAAIMPTNFSSQLASATIYDANDNLVVYQTTAGLNIDIATTQVTIPANRKVVIFVNGDLRIYDGAVPDQDRTGRITVTPGGFLAFIVNGNIIIESSVGHSVPNEVAVSGGATIPTAPIIEGVFLAQNQIQILSKGANISDKKFIGEGSFIGLGGVTLSRKFDSGTTDPFDREKNSYSPVDQFIFNPSLIAATPNFLRDADLTWEETN